MYRKRYRSSGNSARIKIDSPTLKLAQKIIEVLIDNFEDTITSPIMESQEGGFHTFINVKEAKN